jgi:hypothetical protein
MSTTEGPERTAEPERLVVIRLAKQAVVAALFATAALLGGISGFFFAYADDLPEISGALSRASSRVTDGRSPSSPSSGASSSTTTALRRRFVRRSWPARMPTSSSTSA